MKTGLILKSADIFTTDEDMVLINQYTRRQLSKDEVYIFSLVLCDNDVDRDYERFSVKALEGLSKLFMGKTGIKVMTGSYNETLSGTFAKGGLFGNAVINCSATDMFRFNPKSKFKI